VSFSQKVTVVTGASSGIGRRTALDLAAEGASVCAVARREDRLRELLGELRGPGEHTIFVADVADRARVAGLARHVEETYGRCDVLVNNAGMSRGRVFSGEESVADVEAVMATNFFGTVYCTAALLPLLERSAPAHVVNVASVAGRLSFGTSSAYCASKFATVGWSEGIRFDLEASGVYVSLVEPGPIPTEGFSQKALVDHPVLKHVLGTEGDVSRAIRDAIEGRKMERVVPRWYYLLQIPRILVPPLYRRAARRFSSARAGS